MDRKNKARFTNEELSKKFKNSFELVNYAIALAENMIKSGRDTRVKSDTQNRAMLILEEINQGKDEFDEITETAPRHSQSQAAIDGELQQQMIYEDRQEKRKQQQIIDDESIED